MKRSAIREHIFRILFRHDFYNVEEFDSQVDLYFENALADEDAFFKSFQPDELTIAEIKSRLSLVVAKLPEIDERLSAVCEGWSLNRIGKAELAILRLATYEIIFDEELENAIAINEAVELAKKYCDEKSHSFVNGVLAKIIK